MIIAATGAVAEYPRIDAAIAPRIKPTTIPNIPPIKHKSTDSMINCNRMELFLAPNAFHVPISRVRSVTDTSIMFITPIPPTNNEIPAINAIAIDTVCTISVIDSVIDSIVEVDTS